MSTTLHPHPLKSHLSPDIFLHVPPNLSPLSSVRPRSRRPRVIFFVTGNPGLIAYYHAFLSLLSTSGPATDCVVAGFSLGGFEIDDRDGSGEVRDGGSNGGWLQELQFPDRAADAGPGPERIYGLEEQIVLTEKRVWALVRRVCQLWEDGVADESMGKNEGRRREGGVQVQVEVVLMGHSVGAYIVLEFIRRHAQQQQWKDSKSEQGNAGPAFDIKGAVLLTPTIVDIAHSASGRVLTPLVTYIPGFAALVAGAAKRLGGVLGNGQLRGVVRWVTGMPDRDGDGGGAGAGVSALDATVAFLRSERGVRQALEMARQEVRMIGKDRWGSEVWGVERAVVTGAMGTDDDWKRKEMRRPKLVFYFAKTDHWVADQTREELLRIRGRLEGEGEEWKPTMVVDEEDGLVHGWCIAQSGLVASKVVKWLEDILGDGEDGVGRRE